MTRFVLDVASYQGALAVADVYRAGFSAVNLKVSHGLGVKSVHPDVAGWVAGCRRYGLGISTFHFLDGSASGAAQARHAYDRLITLRLTQHTAHQVDCEADASEQILREYVTTMQQLLERPVAVYSGRWWWEPRGWNVTDLTPYLWSSPRVGYLGSYPGDTSAHWAGYGGWPELAAMQYAVQPLIFDDGTSGTIKVSKSAVRDDAVWQALTGGDPMAWILVPCLRVLREEFNRLAPNRDKTSDGSIGDSEHSQVTSDHNPDETGKTATEDADSVNEVHAIDVDASGPWPDGMSMERAVQFLIARHRTGTDNRLQNIIYNRRIWSRSWGWTERAYDGPNPHDKHAHFGARYATAQEADTSPWGLLEEFDMTKDEMLALLRSPEGKAAIGAAVVDADADRTAEGQYTLGGAATDAARRTNYMANTQIPALATAFKAFVTAETADDAAREQALAELRKAVSAVPDETVARLGAASSPEEKAELLRVALGDDAPAVGRLLAG